MIRDARRSKEWTQQTLAAAAGVDLRTVAALEKGQGTLASLRACLEALGLALTHSPADLARIRRDRCTSLAELARKAKVARPTLHLLEATGEGRVETLAAMAKAHGVKLRAIPQKAERQAAATVLAFTPRSDNMTAHAYAGGILYAADALAVLQTMQADSVNCVVTSPPYRGLKTYDGGSSLGHESTVAEYIANLCEITREFHRVVIDSGSLWLVIGDSYAGKVQQLVPARLALAMQEQGWELRQEVIWSKRAGLSSATDRMRVTDERILHFVKDVEAYYFEDSAIRTPHRDGGKATDPNGQRQRIVDAVTLTESEKLQALAELERRVTAGLDIQVRLRGQKGAHRNGSHPGARDRALERDGYFFHTSHEGGAMPASVWDIAPVSDALHPCVTPEEIVERCIKSTCPSGGTVLDPFAGSGTTLRVAQRLGRQSIGIEISPVYVTHALASVQVLKSRTRL